MYDAVTPANIPRTAAMVAGYVNGKYAWAASDWARFPNAVQVQISVRAAWTVGHVLDVEPGDATPAEAVGWFQARRAHGADPTVYCNLSTWPSVRAAFAAAGVPESHYWIAKYDGAASVYAGSVAKQHTNDAAHGYDVSAVADYWPGVDPAPATVAGASTDDDETEGHMLCKATHAPGATPGDDYIVIPCDGKTSLYIAPAYNRTVKVLGTAAVKDTNGTGAGAYTDMQALNQINPDQPGPIRVGNGCRHVVLRYSADHDFTAWCK
jgi:hypothetical protein